MKYASETNVSAEKSRMEIEQTLRRYGAGETMFGTSPTRALVGFKMLDRIVRFELPLPDAGSDEFKTTKYKREWSPRKLTPEQSRAKWEQACRQRWRALALAIKAKLEAVECGIATFEEEFLAHIVLPNGQTYGEFAIPQIAAAYQSEKSPPLLPWGGGQ